MVSLYCDGCLTPFREADCSPNLTPPGDDWSDFCASCRERKLKYYLEEAEADRLWEAENVVPFRKSASKSPTGYPAFPLA